MKIAMIGTSLFNQGAEYVMAVLTRGFVAKGHQVDLYLSKWQQAWQEQHPDWRPFDVPTEAHQILIPHYRARQMIGYFRQMLKVCGYDVVLLHSSNFVVPMAIASFGLNRRPRIINVCHSCGIGVDSEGNFVGRDRGLKAWLINGLLNRLDASFTVSSGTADGLNRKTGFPRERIHVVYNPVVDDVFKRKLSQEPEHPWLHDSIPVVVAAGVFEPYKNHLMLIRAFADVLKSKVARLIIYGVGGSLRLEYERTINELGLRDVVSLPGHTDNLPAAIQKSACYVISSKVESFSIVCVEALAAGVPVVSTNCPYGPPEILKGGEYGIIVKNKDQQALAEGILKVLNGGGIKPTPEMWAPYTVEATVDRYEKAMAEVMAR